MELAMAEELAEWIFVEDEPQPADIAFIPGNRYPHMARVAAGLFKEGLVPLCLPSGKYATGKTAFEGPLSDSDRYRGPYSTEWDFLRDVLLKEGIPQEAILQENQATYTWQNALFSRDVIQKQGIPIKRAILCCKAYHARRCLLYYQRAFPEVEFLVRPAWPDGITKYNWRRSMEGIHEVLAELERIVIQFSLLM